MINEEDDEEDDECPTAKIAQTSIAPSADMPHATDAMWSKRSAPKRGKPSCTCPVSPRMMTWRADGK